MCLFLEVARRHLPPAFLGAFGEGLVSLVLYGSYARCEPRPTSDVDIFVVLERLPADRLELHRALDMAEEGLEEMREELGRLGYTPATSPVVTDRAGAARFRPLYIDMAFDAVVLYDKDGFMADVLERVRRRLKELGARRIRIGRRWVVDLKPGLKFGEVIELTL